MVESWTTRIFLNIGERLCMQINLFEYSGGPGSRLADYLLPLCRTLLSKTRGYFGAVGLWHTVESATRPPGDCPYVRLFYPRMGIYLTLLFASKYCVALQCR